MQDMIMNAHLTYLSGRTYVSKVPYISPSAHKNPRSYVFDDYTWEKEGPEFSKFGNNWIPSRIPLSALISGAPRAVVE